MQSTHSKSQCFGKKLRGSSRRSATLTFFLFASRQQVTEGLDTRDKTRKQLRAALKDRQKFKAEITYELIYAMIRTKQKYSFTIFCGWMLRNFPQSSPVSCPSAPTLARSIFLLSGPQILLPLLYCLLVDLTLNYLPGHLKRS